MRGRILVVWSVLLFAHATSSRVRAQDVAAEGPSMAEREAMAREAFQRGRIHYDNGEFDKAAEAFEQAYQLSHRHALLYNLYLAYRDANQQEKAAEALRNYLDRVEVIENRPQLEARLKALQEGIAQRKAMEQKQAEEARAQQAAQAQPSQPSTPEAPDQAGQSAQKWWLTPVIVMGAGGVMMGASAATGAMSNSKYAELHSKCKDNVCDPSLKSTADSGKTLAMVTDALLFGGAAVAATGAVLFFLKKPKTAEETASEPRTSASFVCTSRLCGGSLGMRF